MKRMFKGLDSHEIIVRTRRILSMQRAIATIMLIAMCLSMIPFQVFAADDESIQNDINQSTETEEIKNYEIDKKSIPISFEDTSKRTENEKHFKKADGSYEVAIYDESIHYVDNDQWYDIDNTLKLDSKKESYENTANKFKIKFPKNISNQYINVKMSEYSIDWKFIGSQLSEAKIKTKESIKTQNIKTLQNISQQITYVNILENIDLLYSLNGSKIKEELIMSEYQEDISFSFEYKLTGLTFKETEYGIYLVDKDNNPQFSFDPFIMFDAEKNSSEAIDVSIRKRTEDVYTITVTPNDEWLKKASYPVSIDPTLNSSTTGLSIYDTYISSHHPNSNYYDEDEMKIGNSVYTGEYRGLIRFKIPTLLQHTKINYASINFTKQNMGTNVQINIHKNTDFFASSSATWNNAPNYDNQIVDYYIGNPNTSCTFDITKPIKEWHQQGVRNIPGFTLKLADGQYNLNSVYQQNSSHNPLITIGYEDMSGLKDYWTYTAQDMGALGTGFVCDYTGNLTWVRNEFTIENERINLTLSMYYSYANRDENIGYGYGWKTNYNMIVSQDNHGFYYLQKPDGSKVFFHENEVLDKFISEDGALMELEIGDTEYQIKTRNDITYTFEKQPLGRLKQITNTKSDRSVIVTYTNSVDHKVAFVIDDIGNHISLDYENSLLDDATLSLYQSNSNFQDIEYKHYSYDSNQNLNSVSQNYNYDGDSSFSEANYLNYSFNSAHELNSAQDFSVGTSISYVYLLNGQVSQINTSDSYHDISETTVSYNGNQTTYTSHDGKYVNYLFDMYGHTVNIFDSHGNSQSFRYAGLYTYKSENESEYNYDDIIDSDPNYFLVHHMLEQSKIMKQQPNPIVNHGFEEESGWIYSSTGNIEKSDDKSLLGNNSLAITGYMIPVYAEQEIYLGEGQYTLCAYIQNSGAGSDHIGAYLTVLNATTGGTSIRVYDNDDWQKVEIAFTLDDADYVTIRLNNSSNSVAYFDNVQLNEGFSESRYNVISNASFEYNSNNWITSGSSVSYDSISESGILNDILGQQAIKVVGDAYTDASFYQDLTGYYSNGETYIFSGWAKANAVPNKIYTGIYDDGRYFGLYLEVTYTSDDHGSGVRYIYLPFDASIEGWQYQTYAVSLPDNEDITQIKLFGLYRGEGIAYFDNIQFYHDDLTTGYDYHETGDLAAIIYPDNSETTYDYDNDHHVTEVIHDNQTTNIAYDSNFLVEEVEQNNVRVTNQYDTTTKQLIYQFYGYDNSLAFYEQEYYFSTSTTYELYSQYIHSQTDEFGNTYTYNTNLDSGLISDILDPLNNQTRYTYNDFGQVEYQTFENGTEDVVYHFEYNNHNLLSKVTLGDVKYIFEYDDLDRIAYIYIDENIEDLVVPQLIVGYTYVVDNNFETDLLETKSYANGDTYTFTYTTDKQLESVYFNEETEARVKYIYDASSRLAIVEDIANQNIFYYSYDLADRLEKITDQSGNVINYIYDENGNVVNYNYEITGMERKVSYYYNELTGEYDYTSYTIGNTTYKKTYNYDEDSLKRLHDLVYKVGNNSILTMTYGFDDSHVDVNKGNATLRVYSISYACNNHSDFAYYYQYDANQNITNIEIKDSNGDETQTYEYIYNGLDQLIEEHARNMDFSEETPDKTNCSTYYTYDGRGNITSVDSYAYGLAEGDQILIGTTIDQPYLYNDGFYSLEAAYNGTYYMDTYNLSIGDTPSFSFLFFDVDQGIYVFEEQLIIDYDTNDIDTSTAGYYLMDVHAYNPYYYSYDVYFGILVTVGNPSNYTYEDAEPFQTTAYEYDENWSDLLKEYTLSEDGLTRVISYDTIGNPTSITNFVYDNNTYHHANFIWEGRRLVGINLYTNSNPSTINKTISYAYNDQGIRIGKSDSSGDNYQYILDGDLILVEIINESTYIYYTYDVDGKPISMTYQNNEYFYVYDLQGNVIGLMDDTGSLVVEYKYDAYGNITYQTNHVLANINPFKYRGYQHDLDTGYYYLQSRYYNPEIARFINMDDVSFLSTDNPTGVNLFVYCANNPVMYLDISGEFAFFLLGIVITITGTQILELAAIAAAVTALMWWIDSGSEKTINFINDAILKSNGNDTNLPSLPEGWNFDDPTKSPGEEWEWRGSTDEPVPDEYGKYHGNWVNKDTQDWLHPDLKHPLPEVPHWDYGKHNGPSWRVDRKGNMTPKIAIPKIPY